MAESTLAAPAAPLTFETHPDEYRHIKLAVDGPIARLDLDIQEDGGQREGYELKLNSYDISVDIELADAVRRLRFEHPEVSCVVIGSALEGVFCSGANIFMLSTSTHSFKVNFCKFTNETRLEIEDATQHSGQTYMIALNGVASGGGYELALACEEIYLVDDRRSAVALPEIPFLGVLPGTGGLTRVVDKRHVRRDLADVFVTLAEGVKGKRAVEWGLVDGVFPTSTFDERINERAAEIAKDGYPDRSGVTLDALEPEEDPETGTVTYRHVALELDSAARTATLTVTVPTDIPEIPEDPCALGADLVALRMFRELDDALLRLRFNHPEIGLVLVKTRGEIRDVLAMDEALAARSDHWFISETLHFMKRVCKRMDVTARSFFALVEPGSCFAGSLMELALAADRSYMLEEDGVDVALGQLNAGPLPMGNGLTRLETRFIGDPEKPSALLAHEGPFDATGAEEAGLITLCFDDIDWEDEVRLAVEERAGLSPDALTGMEASIRFPGPETMETKIFGRLSSWQNWIFQRPNAVGETGALTLYGRPGTAAFDWNRT